MGLESATIFPDKDQLQKAVPRHPVELKEPTTDEIRNRIKSAEEAHEMAGFNYGIKAALFVVRRFNGPQSECVKILRSLYNEQLEQF